ncbi:tetratricopeptide repeat-containing sensor histidine kinase [Pontibacter sp. 13R65]|uniref:tetratricopeptide repeat-containing sensor histidine kinase n=1 Tax=Pontibacter sp. 13R65 TaxID=3127458 RepID=UPI00301BB441
MRNLLLLLLFLPLHLQGKNNLADSLALELTKAKSDSERVELHYQLSRRFFLSDVKKGIAHAESAQQLSVQSGYKAGEAKALNLLGYAEVVLGEYDKALDYYFKSLKIAEKTGSIEALTISYNSIGSVYFRIKDNDRALDFYNQSLKLALESKDPLAMSKVYNNIGNIFEAKRDFSKALSYFTKSANLQKELGNKGSWAISLYNIGNLHVNLPYPEKGLPYLFQSLKLNQEIGNKMLLVGTLKGISSIYLLLNQKKEALQYAIQSYEMALETESSKKIADAAYLMQQVYEATGQFEQAHKYLAIYVEQQKLLDVERQQKVLEELTIGFDTEKQELENQKLKAENAYQAIEMEHDRTVQGFGLVVIVLMLGLLLLLELNRRRAKESNLELQKINQYVQAKNLEIEAQKSEISSQARALQIQNEQLEQNSNFKNKLFSIISHDLRNPFQSVKGILNLIQRNGMTENEIKHIFPLLHRDVEAAQNMLHNLLLWSKAQLEGSSVEYVPVNLRQLISENIVLILSQAQQKQILFVNNVEELIWVQADLDRLNFVIRNLLSNAVKFSFAGGQVAVWAEANQSRVTLHIADQGKGISEKNMEKLFGSTRFTTTGTAKEKGTGLGIMFCKDFVESMAGSLQVKSEEGKGSVFSITLAAAEVPAHQEAILTEAAV